MAKDGTARGGARIGSGQKRKALVDKIADGDKALSVLFDPATYDFDAHNQSRSMSADAKSNGDLNSGLSATALNGVDVPEPKEYMKARQKGGKDLPAEEIYKETWLWLRARGCERLVNNQLISQYAMAVSRWIQCEECISEYGFLAKHPTTGNAIASPYVAMSQQYMKQVNQVWFQIYQIVRENCAVEFQGGTPQDDVMERLLRVRENRI